MLSAANIKGKNFSSAKNGFDPDEINACLSQVANDYAALEKQNQEYAQRITELSEQVQAYKSDEAAIQQSLVSAHKESAKILADARAEASEMVESAKSEQTRLAEQSAAECERIVLEHKQRCAELIQQNTEITERKIEEIRANYDEELEAYENLQAEVTYFKANLTELYNKQIRLVMELPTMTPEELEDFEAGLDAYDDEYYEEEYDEEVYEEAEEPAAQAAPAAEESAAPAAPAEDIDTILNTGSFDPVIPKSSFEDLQFGNNN
jgi:cell division initiation protein